MSIYAIGDLQGCFVTLQALLNKIQFSPRNDQLWFVGDLVNRGPGSLECLRFVKALDNNAVTVLGNHDLHLLSVAEGFRRLAANDTLQPILDAPDRDKLLAWLRQQKMFHLSGGYALVHAGLMPSWSWIEAQSLANEIEIALKGAQYQTLLENMYGNDANHWDTGLNGFARQRAIINVMTRMRALSTDGQIDLKFKGELSELPAQHLPWFKLPTMRPPNHTVIAGHWSALGLHISPNFIGLDSGCVWGKQLTAFRLEDRAVFQVDCAETQLPTGWD